MQRTPTTGTTTMSRPSSTSGLVTTVTTSVLVITRSESPEFNAGDSSITQTSPTAAGNTVTPTELSGNLESKKTGAIAGAVIGSLSVIALVAGFGIYYQRRKAKQSEAIPPGSPSFKVLGSNARAKHVQQVTNIASQEPLALLQVISDTTPACSVAQAANSTTGKASVYEPFRYRPQASDAANVTAPTDTFNYPHTLQPSLHSSPAHYRSMSSIATEPYQHGFQVYRNVPTSTESSPIPSNYRERSRFTELEAHGTDNQREQSSGKEHWELP